METIATHTLQAAFAAAIRAIVPTFEPLRAIGWSYTPSPRKNRRAMLLPATRNFDLIFRNPGPTHRWVGGDGTAYQAELAVCASYAGVEPETRDHMKAQDAVDIHRALRRLINTPELDGLCEIEFIGEANEIEAEASHYVEHTFTVHYHQATK